MPAVPPVADRLLRIFWREAHGERLELRDFFESLADRGGMAPRRIVLRRAPRLEGSGAA